LPKFKSDSKAADLKVGVWDYVENSIKNFLALDRGRG
jgi:hypothetical protein